jgi:hypothetical protein
MVRARGALDWAKAAGVSRLAATKSVMPMVERILIEETPIVDV